MTGCSDRNHLRPIRIQGVNFQTRHLSSRKVNLLRNPSRDIELTPEKKERVKTASQAGPTLQVRSSSERKMERIESPHPCGNEEPQRREKEEEGDKEEDGEEERFSSSCALPPSIRWENVSTLASSSAGDHSSNAGELTPNERKFENRESPAKTLKIRKGDCSKGERAAAEEVGPGEGHLPHVGGIESAKEEPLRGGNGDGERYQDIPRPATTSSGGIFFSHILGGLVTDQLLGPTCAPANFPFNRLCWSNWFSIGLRNDLQVEIVQTGPQEPLGVPRNL